MHLLFSDTYLTGKSFRQLAMLAVGQVRLQSSRSSMFLQHPDRIYRDFVVQYE